MCGERSPYFKIEIKNDGLIAGVDARGFGTHLCLPDNKKRNIRFDIAEEGQDALRPAARLDPHPHIGETLSDTRLQVVRLRHVDVVGESQILELRLKVCSGDRRI